MDLSGSPMTFIVVLIVHKTPLEQEAVGEIAFRTRAPREKKNMEYVVIFVLGSKEIVCIDVHMAYVPFGLMHRSS